MTKLNCSYIIYTDRTLGGILKIIISNYSDMPIYEQIKSQIKRDIISGDLKEGDKLPSIRKLAKELKISVITTKRAFDDLEKEGFVHSVQGKGNFVSYNNNELIIEEYILKTENCLKQAMEYADLAGLSIEELIDILKLLEVEDE